MGVEGILISFKVNKNPNAFYESGILLNSDLVLVPGNILLPFVEEGDWVSTFLKSSSMELKPNFSNDKILFRVFLETKSENDDARRKLNFFDCQIARVWKCPAVSESVYRLFSDWTVGYLNSTKEQKIPFEVDAEITKELMSVFVLLRRQNGLVQCNNLDDERILNNLMFSLEEPNRGQKVEIVSTPFGNEHFMNSLSHGIISNVTGIDRCIILSDAKTAPGSEGGPIFTPKKSREAERKLIGQVICPLSWWKGEWVGLTIGVNLIPVLKALVKPNSSGIITNYFGNNLSSHSSDSLLLDLVDETVVLIRSKTCWGSGIVLNATSGVIITCSHVVKNDEKVSVLYKAKLRTASVIFRSREDVAYDLAVIKLEESFVFRKEIEFSEYPAEIGDAVYAAGFPFFSEQVDLHVKPTVGYGSVAKCNPYMIQTTCCIQSGFSGGALLRNGKLLGIIVSNARNSVTGATFPHINLIVPSLIFKTPVLKYIQQNDIGKLKELESSSSRVQLLWKLQVLMVVYCI